MFLVTAALGLFKSYRIWIIGAAMAGMVLTVMLHFNNDATREVKLRQAEGRVQLLEIVTKDQGLIINDLNDRIKANNQRWLDQLQQEQDRLRIAKNEAEKVKKQRDTLTAELAKSRQTWREALNDPDLVEFVALPVPAAVWDRLRSVSH